MKDHTQPLLTIGIIFKDENRCLERCLESLTPLRENVSCELIMADTGSSDGSREIASRYADTLFDFPWVNDFSAARNAVMERASGEWYLTIDCDEYLDGDISELVDFLHSPKKSREAAYGVIQRNYSTAERDGIYSDFLAARLLRMSTGLRYQGSIHESWPLDKLGITDVPALAHTILHHDGYADIDDEYGRKKSERNLALLRGRLKESPEDLRILLQYIESGRQEKDYLETLRRTMKLVEAKPCGWKEYGPPVFRYAVKTALEEELPEFWEWVRRSRKLFSDSFYTRIDIEYMAFSQALKEQDHAAAVRYGENYLKSLDEFYGQDDAMSEIIFDALLMSSPFWEHSLRIYLSDIYIKGGTPERAGTLLQDIDGTVLDRQLTGNMLCVLGDLHRLSRLDTAPMILKIFEGIKKPIPSEETARKREEVFIQTAKLAFLSETRTAEPTERNFCRPSYGLFLPLINECEIGRGAAVLSLEDPAKIQLVLEKVEDWEEFPIEALAHAIFQGTTFPLPAKQLTAEVMDRLAKRLAEDTESLCSIIRYISKEAPTEDIQKLAWTDRLVLSGVQNYDWVAENSNTALGMDLARFFARTEEAYLSQHYKPELLREEAIAVLPALHRFGWHCAKAFKSLDARNPAEYVQELREGLHTCKAMKPMVEWLTVHTSALRKETVSPELLALAEQVRALLASYPPENAAVQEIKASPVYQKVAWLIEDGSTK